MCFPPLLAIAPPTELALAVVWRPPPPASRIAEPLMDLRARLGQEAGEAGRVAAAAGPNPGGFRCRENRVGAALASGLLLSLLPFFRIPSALSLFCRCPRSPVSVPFGLCPTPQPILPTASVQTLHTLRHRKSCQLSSLRRPLFPAFLGHPTPNWPALCRNPEFIRKTWREGRRGVGIEIREAEDIGSTPLRDTQIF